MMQRRQHASLALPLSRCHWISSTALAALVFLLSSGSASSQELLWDHIGAQPREGLPTFFANIGDQNGDGHDDFLYEVVGYSLIRSGLDGTILHTHLGVGSAVASMGLFNDDAVPDYALTNLGISGPGAAFIYSGANHEVIMRIQGTFNGEGFGRQVVPVGDVNGDGHQDVGVSTLFGGFYRIFLGPLGTLLREHTGASSSPFAYAPYGDWDGDGCDDYLMGNDATGTIPGTGSVTLRSGRTGEVLLTMEGDKPGRAAGWSVCLGGDWNGDGIEDVATGAPGTTSLNNVQNLAGAYVFSGADGSILHFFDGEAFCLQNSAFGYSVSSGKDVNGDGVPDLIVGAPLEPYVNMGVGLSGSAFVFSGATKQLLWEKVGSQFGQRAGMQVALIDDHNGDGLADWMVISPRYDATPLTINQQEGRLSLFAGAPGDATPVCAGGPNSVGAGASLWNTGAISVRENSLEWVVSQMPQNAAVLLIQGQQLAPPVPFGAGELCVAGPLTILAAALTNSTGTPGEPASVSFPLDLFAPPFSFPTAPLRPGDSWAFQALYRDQGQRNTSNAMGVTFLP